MPKIKRPNFGRYSWIPWYYFYPVWSCFISNTDVSTVGLILRRLGSNEVRPSPEMTKNIFLILKIWLITIEGIRSDTLDLTQVRIVVSRIKFFQTQKQDHIRLPPIPPEVKKLYEPIKRQCFGLCNCTYNPYWWCFWWLRKLYWYCRTCCWASLESIGRPKQWLLTPLSSFTDIWSFNSQKLKKQIDRHSVSQFKPKKQSCLNQSWFPSRDSFLSDSLVNGDWSRSGQSGPKPVWTGPVQFPSRTICKRPCKYFIYWK